ncbi:KinB-signaling pathway activation protein [Fervidibacillus halotolerans]|uniref:KinB-signaling pathway activation protein n=1 Tax=Fervidibacillus halotolerans TaxID=2980027 RepID=A0A9E8M192_9BACI|nr:KinB-signaling pathway activation protein [Fervidibacillus halotolerans]WAA12444.1 KinB-signaling pathway activation protein [Fervidibacillus halotolerans]
MNTKNWVKFFLRTLFIGGIVTIVTGFIVQWEKYEVFFTNFDMIEILSIAVWLMGVGFIFAVLSQMGFFAYLTLHRIGLGIFRSYWNSVQWVLIAFVLFDLVYFRYRAFAEDQDPLWPYVLVAVLIFSAGLVVAYLKSLQSDRRTFIPALFFMVVVTVVEWVPVLRVNDTDWLYLMIFPLFICNAYQLLTLPKFLQKSKEERIRVQRKKEVKA